MTSLTTPTNTRKVAPIRILRWLWRPRRLLAMTAMLIILALVGLNVKGWQDFRAAKKAYEAVEYDQAEAKIQKCLRIWFWRPSMQIWAARIARGHSDYRGVEKHLAQAKRFGADQDSLQMEWILTRVSQGELDHLASGLWKSVDGGHPQAVFILEAMTRQYMRELRFFEALKCLNRWLEMEPDTVRAMTWRGWVYEHIEMYDQAMAEYKRTLELAPDQHLVRRRLAFVHLGFHAPKEALEHFLILQRAGVDDLEIRCGIADCRLQLGEEDEAREELEQILSQNPDDVTTLRLLGAIQQHGGDYAKAEASCRHAIALAPYDIDAHYTLFLSLTSQPGRETEAKAEEQVYNQLKERRMRVDGLILQMDKYKDRPEPMAELGDLYLNLGREQEGLHWLYEAMKRDPRYKPAHETLAKYFEAHHDPRAAQHREFLEANK